MGLLKRTYTLPQETIEAFERSTPPGKRSALIAELMHEWLERQRRERLRREVIEGCREMADVYLAIEREFQPLEEEVERAFLTPPRTRPNPRQARS
ncbi:MAG TPA: hypothetical protein VFW33_01520 [Gemmataceae bacterium]|nr:hypothetical protein [Gemmataceae bacterium]